MSCNEASVILTSCKLGEKVMHEPEGPPVARTVEEVREAVRLARLAGRSVGLVPTMGALHEGTSS